MKSGCGKIAAALHFVPSSVIVFRRDIPSSSANAIQFYQSLGISPLSGRLIIAQ